VEGSPSYSLPDLPKVDDPAAVGDSALHPHRQVHRPLLPRGQAVAAQDTQLGLQGGLSKNGYILNFLLATMSSHYLVARVDEVHKLVAHHLLHSEPHELLDVAGGVDDLPISPHHQGEPIQAG